MKTLDILLEKKFEALKHAVQYEENSKSVFEMFFTITESSHRFNEISMKSDDKFIDIMMRSIIKKIFNDYRRLELIIEYIPDFNFFHGNIVIDSMPGGFLYFENIKMGIISIIKSPAGEILFIRFSGEDVLPGGYFVNTKNTTTH